MIRLPDNIRLAVFASIILGRPKINQVNTIYSVKLFAQCWLLREFYLEVYDNFIKNSLPVYGNFGYSDSALDKSNVGFDIPSRRADYRLFMRFFYVRHKRYALIMVGRNEGANALAGFSSAGMSTLLRLATTFDIVERGSTELRREATAMVTIPSQTHPKETKFTDTYWIIRLDSNIPYGKVSLTHRERRLFHVLFKDDRLVWSGRKPITPQSIIECSASHAQEVAYV